MKLNSNPYLAGLELVKINSGTSGQVALAKCILSLYNPDHSFSIGEVLGSLDERYTAVVLNMVKAYATEGETEELRKTGRFVYDNFPRLIELSEAACEAKASVRREWERQREEESARLYPNE